MAKRRAKLAVIRVEAVRDFLTKLAACKIHPTFAGYLCLLRAAAVEGTTSHLSPAFKEFFDSFFLVPGATRKWPYYRPFWDERTTARKSWMNANVSGSYAPSSIRAESPFRKVVEIEGERRAAMYSLRPKHWQLARTHLAYGGQVPAVALAGFLYRDYGFRVPRGLPTAADVLSVFRHEFGYDTPGSKKANEFEHLYNDDSAEWTPERLFEVLPP